MDEGQKVETIDTLKQDAKRLLEEIRRDVMKGDFKLRPEIENAILTDSAIEIDRTPERQLDDVLKARGVNRNDRRRIIAKSRSKGVEPTIPAHTRRANGIARKQAVARATKKAAQS